MASKIKRSITEDLESAGSIRNDQEHKGRIRNIQERSGAMGIKIDRSITRGPGVGWLYKERSGA